MSKHAFLSSISCSSKLIKTKKEAVRTSGLQPVSQQHRETTWAWNWCWKWRVALYKIPSPMESDSISGKVVSELSWILGYCWHHKIACCCTEAPPPPTHTHTHTPTGPFPALPGALRGWWKHGDRTSSLTHSEVTPALGLCSWPATRTPEWW